LPFVFCNSPKGSRCKLTEGLNISLAFFAFGSR
jgi:hypothetical protein